MATLTDSAFPRSLPPGPRGLPLLGSFRQLLGDGPAFLHASAQEYGDIVHYRVGPADVFLLVHPDLIKDVLVTHQHNFIKGRGLEWSKVFLGEGLLTSEGEHHRRQRRLAQPAFHRERLQAYAQVMTEHADRMRQRWTDGATVDMSQEMARLTLGIVGKTLFDAEVESEAEDVGRSLTAILKLFYRFALPFGRVLNFLPLPSNFRFVRAKRRLDALIYGMIEDRRRTRRDHGDLLSMLLLARDEEGDGGGMTDQEVRDEAMTLFLAGHETTANALTWTWYLVSEHPEAAAKLHCELDSVLAGRLPTFDDLPRLRYCESVLAESMRLYPPAPAIARRPLTAYPAGGYVFPALSTVVMSPYVTQRDPRFFPDPLRFDPDRWTPELRASRPKFAYFPFGGGARQCIGESFAWMEGTLLIAALAQQWTMQLVPGHPVEARATVTLRPRHGMKMTLTRRP